MPQTLSYRHLFVTDMDGTLLNSKALISNASARMINEAIDQGALFTVATARTPATVVNLLRQIRIRVPAIVFTGAALWNFDRQRFDNMHFISEATTEKALSICRNEKIRPFIYTLNTDNKHDIIDVYFNFEKATDNELRFIAQRQDSPYKRFRINTEQGNATSFGNTILIFAMGERGQTDHTAQLLRDETDCSISSYADTYTPEIGILEIFAPTVSKANAIKTLKKQTGATHVTVFGDNLNDMPMMRIADTSVAVGNALQQVKDAADIVIAPNDTDSVVRYILDTVSAPD